MNRILLVSIALSACVAWPTVLHAQSTDDDSVFDFSLPGSRSRAMGGAFVAIADDASSVYSNPAGLTSLFRPEISLEVRRWSLTNLIVNEGHAYGRATGTGLDTIDGIRERAYTASVKGVSFFSFAYPRGKWAVGVFHHQLARYKMNRQSSGAFFDCFGGGRGDTGSPPFCEVQGVNRLFPADQTYDLSIRGTGATFTRQWMMRAPKTKPDEPTRIPTRKFSLGLSVQYFDFSLSGSRMVYNARGPLTYLPANRTLDNLELEGVRRGDDGAVGVNVGALYDVTEKIAVGATFRQGPKFRYEARTTTGAGNLDGGGGSVVDTAAAFKVPDTWALGAAYRPNNNWRLGLEYDRVQYGQLLDQLVNTAHGPDDPEGQVLERALVQENANQWRLGGEYSTVSFQDLLLSVRAGYWYDPLHQPYLRVEDPNTGAPAAMWSLLFPKRQANSHATFGVGVATRQRFQVDIAVDYAKSVTIVAASAVVRF